MKDIDRMIREALQDEDAELMETLSGQQPIHEAITDLFRFRPRWLLFTSMLVTLAAIAVAVYAAYRFYAAPHIREMLLWGALFFVCVLGVHAMKVWSWLEMSKNATTREIKRLELQVARLASLVRRSAAGSQNDRRE
ncbi:MAG: hypothetical protein D6800_00110 [Candidatus Zixiibacteriota bacterium]|nr:MAG: hypothetical protein D6800_00110 [candidate division Zixibacteria bacterium]